MWDKLFLRALPPSSHAGKSRSADGKVVEVDPAQVKSLKNEERYAGQQQNVASLAIKLPKHSVKGSVSFDTAILHRTKLD